MNALAQFISSDHLLVYGWLLPSGVFVGMTLLAGALLRATPQGRRVPWLARLHPMFLMLHPQHSPTVVNKPTAGIMLAWLFLALVPGGNLLMAVLYMGLMLARTWTGSGLTVASR